MFFEKDSDKIKYTKYNRKPVKRAHPHRVLAIILLVVVAFVFAALLTGFVTAQLYQMKTTKASVPYSFLISAVLLLLTLVSCAKTKFYLKHELYQKAVIGLMVTILFQLLYLLVQALGFTELQSQQIELLGQASSVYLYLIPALHYLLVTTAVVYELLMVHYVFKASLDPVASLIFSTDPYRLEQFRICKLVIYFAAISWVIEVITFAMFM